MSVQYIYPKATHKCSLRPNKPGREQEEPGKKTQPLSLEGWAYCRNGAARTAIREENAPPEDTLTVRGSHSELPFHSPHESSLLSQHFKMQQARERKWSWAHRPEMIHMWVLSGCRGKPRAYKAWNIYHLDLWEKRWATPGIHQLIAIHKLA